jgi:membrane protease YdiL (CAAX protease family)
MFKLNKNQVKILIIFIQILLTYTVFWFLLGNLTTNGVWETVILNVLFFWVLPSFLLKKENQPKEPLKILDNNQKLFFSLQVVGVWLVFIAFIVVFKNFSFLKINYLARLDWYLVDWWLIWALNLVLLPIILYSQELFFRKFLFENFKDCFSIKKVLFFQVLFFVMFEILFFEIFTWQFVLFNLILSLILGYFYYQTRSVWYSFFVRWGVILILEMFILSKLQSFKM